MDKRSILGFVLIAVILMGWLYWSSSIQNKNPDVTKKEDTTSQPLDSGNIKNEQTPDTTKEKDEKTSTDTTQAVDSLNMFAGLKETYGEAFYKNSTQYAEQIDSANEKIITVENSKAIKTGTGTITPRNINISEIFATSL